jgi:hypothetical protein
MFSKSIIIMLTGCVSVASVGNSAENDQQTIVVKGNEVSTYTPSDAAYGNHYVIQFQVPTLPPGETIESALLEFYVDAASRSRQIDLFTGTDSALTMTYDNDVPVIEVYALTGAMGAELDPSRLDSESRTIRPVLVGSRRYVQMDVTPIVRAFAANPGRNRGLVIGSVSGMREGAFTLLSGVLADGAVARIRLYAAPRR